MSDQSRVVSRSTVVPVPPEQVFALLADPAAHPGLDGTGTVKAVVAAPERLGLGAEFAMRMGGYTTRNTVVEYAENATIAWRHRGRHVWRWTLEPMSGGTRVTETFDWSAKRAPGVVRAIGIPRRADRALAATLDGLRRRFDGTRTA